MVTKATRDVLDLNTRQITNGLRVAGDNSVNFSINGTTVGLTTPSDGQFVNLTTTNLTVTGANGFTPVGGVIMFNAAFASIPANWQLCDGTNGTPDMTDQFVYGTNTEGELLDTGGSADAIIPTHTHVADGVGNHNHSYSHTSAAGSGIESGGEFGVLTGTSNTANAGAHTHTINDAGEDPTGKNIPPYIKLAFIQRMA